MATIWSSDVYVLNQNVKKAEVKQLFAHGRDDLGIIYTDDDKTSLTRHRFDGNIDVSVDGGVTWIIALEINRADGSVTLPNTSESGGGSNPITPIQQNDNLLINGDFYVNQRGFAGGPLSAGVFGFDRWKAGAAGANLSKTGFTLTLNSGSILQNIIPVEFGFVDLAEKSITVSVDAPSANLTVKLGDGTAKTIAAGAGRSSVTFTTQASDNGVVTLELSANSAVSFGRVKMEIGDAVTDWQRANITQELAKCQRYYVKLPSSYFVDAFVPSGGFFSQFLALPVTMRVNPVSSFTTSQASGILSYSIATNSSNILLGIQRSLIGDGRSYIRFSSVALDAEL